MVSGEVGSAQRHPPEESFGTDGVWLCRRDGTRVCNLNLMAPCFSSSLIKCLFFCVYFCLAVTEMRTVTHWCTRRKSTTYLTHTHTRTHTHTHTLWLSDWLPIVCFSTNYCSIKRTGAAVCLSLFLWGQKFLITCSSLPFQQRYRVSIILYVNADIKRAAYRGQQVLLDL